MQTLFNIINIPLSYVIRFLSELFGGNFAAAVFAFTLVANLALIPLSIKSQKSSVQQTRIKPKLDELKKKYGDDKQKYSQAMQTLYQEEGVSMSGGCLPMILRLVLMMSIYWLIMSPLTYMVKADKTQINNVSQAVAAGMNDLNKNDKAKYDEINNEVSIKIAGNSVNELSLVKLIHHEGDIVKEILSEDEYKKIEKDLTAIKKADADADINYYLFGIDLTESPKFSFDIFHKAQLIWIMPIMAFLAQMLSSALSLVMQKKINPDAPNMAGMMLTMPIISLFIGFTFAGGVTFYWTCSSLIGGIIQVGVQNFYGPHKMLSRERLKDLVKQCNLEETQKQKLRENAVSESGDK